MNIQTQFKLVVKNIHKYIYKLNNIHSNNLTVSQNNINCQSKHKIEKVYSNGYIRYMSIYI